MADTPLPQIALADTARETTRLGFGGSGLMGGLSEQESLHLLDAAYEAGIRHFDVAPSYGHGQAERCLGKFLRNKCQHVTVTTKYGILPPRHSGFLDIARRMARPVVRLTATALPSIRQRVAGAAASLKSRANFSVVEAKASLDRSLRELGLDRMDVLLLHEATAEDLADNALLDYLQQQVHLGRIGSFGIGSDLSHIPALWEQRRAYCRVLQFDWPGWSADLNSYPNIYPNIYPGAFRIHHRVWNAHGPQIEARLKQDELLRKRWSDAVDLDLSSRNHLAVILIAAALLAHPRGIVIFSSRTPAHILANAHAASDVQWIARAEQFQRLIFQEKLHQVDVRLPR